MVKHVLVHIYLFNFSLTTWKNNSGMNTSGGKSCQYRFNIALQNLIDTWRVSLSK